MFKKTSAFAGKQKDDLSWSAVSGTDPSLVWYYGIILENLG